MSSKGPARPAPVTAAGWMVVLGGAFLVLTSFEQLSGMRSLENRKQVEEFLAEPPGSGLGIGLESALDTLHVLTIVTGCCAAAAAVLGFHVLQRNRAARIALSAVTVPLFVAGLVLGGILTALVAVAAMTLWLKPARDWFDGKEPTTRPGDRDGSAAGLFGTRRRDDGRPGRDEPSDQAPDPARDHAPDEPSGGEPQEEERPLYVPASGGDGPRAYAGFGGPGAQPGQPEQQGPAPAGAQTGPHPSAYGQPGPQPWGPPSPWQAGPPRPVRPSAVLVAAVTTWVTTGIVGMLTTLLLVVLVAAPDDLLDAIEREDPGALDSVARSTLVGVTLALALVLVLWCVIAAVLAGFVVRGDGWARVALMVSAFAAAAGSLVVAFSSLVLVLPFVASLVVALCLARPEVRRWSRR